MKNEFFSKISPQFIFIAIILLLNNNVLAQWSNVKNPGSRVLSSVEINGILYIGTEDNGILKSSSGGENWTPVQTNLFETVFNIVGFQSRNDTIWVASYGGGVVVSYDLGLTWHSFSNGFETQPFIMDIGLFGDTLYTAISYEIGFMPSGVYKTSINEDNWKIAGINFPPTIYGVMDLEITPEGNFFVGSALAGLKGNINVSIDSAKTWEKRVIPNVGDVNSFYYNDNKLYAATSDGVYYTNNSGIEWIKLSEELNHYYVDDILIQNGNIFLAVDQIGVMVSKDNGSSWSIITGNLTLEKDYINKLFIHNENLYAAMNAIHGLWKIPLIIAEVNEPKIPTQFILEQNYPNPFNPTTKIKFSILPDKKRETSNVKLIVYDVLAREIKTLLNKPLQAGNFEVEFDGGNLSSGVYYYKLSAGNFSETKKMLLLR